jgi:ion channel-forming bestrophin family protein
MYAKRNYGFWMTLNWSKKPFIIGLIYTSIVAACYYFCKKQFNIDISLPWQPIGTLGVAVSFYLGFKNNASYDRTWEARKIWGAIVNNSRSFGASAQAYIKGENRKQIIRELIYRHIAWLTALRCQLRLSKEWEHTTERLNQYYVSNVCESYYSFLDEQMQKLISKEEMQLYKEKTNMAAQILRRQTERLEELYENGQIDLFKQLELQKLISSFYDEQGKSERIKNFPFPRQYASTTLWITVIFSLLMPFGMLDIMENGKTGMFWLSVPLTAMTIWVFFLMEMIGDYSENPFEGTYNDIPITAISRSIEIDLREMINDTDIPKPITPNEHGFLM